MATKKTRFIKGIILAPDSVNALEGIEGELKVNGAGKLQATLGAASREIITADQSQTLTSKTIDAASNTISNLTVPMLASGVLDTDLTSVSTSDDTLPSAKAVKTYVDTKVASKDEASEITVSPAVAGATNVQTALSNINTAIVDHIADTSDAHDASAISVSAITNLTATDAQAAFQEIQGDIDSLTTNKVTGPASATDEAIARYDLTTGKLIQNSLVKINDTGEVTGATKLTVDTITLDGSKVGTTATAGSHIDVGSIITVTTPRLEIASKVNFTNPGVSITGANATLPIGNSSYCTLDTAGLLSIEMITGATAVSTLLLVSNNTGSNVDLLNETGATATAQIYTGTGSNFTLLNKQTVLLSYSQINGGKWVIVGGNSPDLEYYAPIANNQSSVTDITGMVLNDSLYRGFTIDYLIWRATDINSKTQYGQLRATYNANTSTWYLSDNYTGENAGVEFSIALNQVQYTSTNLTGADYNGYIKFIFARQITG
jgi:hypothetical protein